MARYLVIVAYDGTHFEGYQRQAKARTVQGTVETALRQLGWRGRTVASAGRTDTGVHASGQVIAFDLEWDHPADELLRALNANLPGDVAVRQIWTVDEGFEPRFAALSRRYRYRLFCESTRDPLHERYAWRVWPVVELERLQAAARVLVGSHDFAAFGSAPRPGGSTVRDVVSASWENDGRDLIFEVSANAFLYRMVRRMVAVQVMAGQGKITVEQVERALNGAGSLPAGIAPAAGLMLVEVTYPQDSGGDNRNINAEG